MNRPLALACASLLAGVVLSVTASAQPADLSTFRWSHSEATPTKIQASFRDDRDGRRTQQLVDRVHAVRTHRAWRCPPFALPAPGRFASP